MDICPICSKQFIRHYVRKGQRQIYCSKNCRFKDGFITRECPTCHKRYTVHKFHLKRRPYCSLACFKRLPCLACGQIIMGRATFQSKNRQFCSRQCASTLNRTARGLDNYKVRGFANTIRLLGTIQCERCFEVRLAALEVHHKDHNRKNNTEDNLTTLCATCHAIEHRSKSASLIHCAEAAIRYARLTISPQP